MNTKPRLATSGRRQQSQKPWESPVPRELGRGSPRKTTNAQEKCTPESRQSLLGQGGWDSAHLCETASSKEQFAVYEMNPCQQSIIVILENLRNREKSAKQKIATHDPVTYGLTFSFLTFFYGYFGARWYNSDDAVQITSILPSSPNVRQLFPVGRKNFLQAQVLMLSFTPTTDAWYPLNHSPWLPPLLFEALWSHPGFLF